MNYYQTGQPIPGALIDNLIKSIFVNTGLSNSYQLHHASFDISLHIISSKAELEASNIGVNSFDKSRWFKMVSMKTWFMHPLFIWLLGTSLDTVDIWILKFLG